ncbi:MULTISPECIES: DUF6520 family protein [Flavobacterium]|uniref:Uncharacterized protein n=1 Tax=Flavobacterium aquidurense TaxID=362413 RepID=A0A0N8VMN8_9FLAO|nr:MULTISPECIES: DUF6520 family protein [Flavobacterium]KQB39844.1 hypothetical protein RC62_1538 [Flavobacterium aquidurense]OMQ11503.1 hypothetical protein BXU01_08120 [[Flexibacter] sp. ATCC 35103]
MKTLFFKKGMPIATAVLAIAGAFATTSMQSSSSAFQLKTGFVLEPSGECNIAVACSDIPSSQVCRLSYPIGDQAFQKTPITGNCNTVLYRP